MKAYDYKHFSIASINDVIELEGIIKTYGGFKNKDYERCLYQASRCLQHTLITLKLNKIIKPLIQRFETSDISPHPDVLRVKSLNEEKLLNPKGTDKKSESIDYASTFSRQYKASDFTILDGRIEIGPFYLKSFRIHRTDTHLLENIDHIFHIKPDANNQLKFHFDPYTDLSFLLEEIARQAIIYKAQQRRIEYERIRVKLETDIDYYITENSKDNIQHREYPYWFHYENVFEALKNYNVINGTITFEEFLLDLYECNIQVPYRDIEIYDKEIKIRIDNVEFLRNLNWSDFSTFIIEKYDVSFFNNWRKEINDLFQEKMEIFKYSFYGRKIISIDTHMSRRSFIEAINKTHKTKYYGMNIIAETYNEEPPYLVFPEIYLRNDFNNGINILIQIPNNILNECLTSEPYEFSDRIHETMRIMLDNYTSFNQDSYVLNMLRDFRPGNIRVMTNLYKQNILTKEYYKINKDSLVLRFRENCAHCSDYDQQFANERNTSYLIIDTQKNFLSLIPTNNKYAIYNFITNTDVCDPILSAYFLILYFQSNIHNKRQYFALTPIFNHFGITHFWRQH